MNLINAFKTEGLYNNNSTTGNSNSKKKCKFNCKSKVNNCCTFVKDKFNRIMIIILVVIYLLLQAQLILSLWMYFTGWTRLEQINISLCSKMT